MKIKNKLLLILISVFLLNSCGSNIKEALEGKRRSKSGDEFLIQKKNPLSLPPAFGDLPIPSEDINESENDNNNNLEKILNKNQTNDDSQDVSYIEKLILEEMNKN